MNMIRRRRKPIYLLYRVKMSLLMVRIPFRFRRLALDGSTSDVYRGEYDAETKTVTFENANLIGDMYKDGLIQIQKFRLFGCKMEHIR